MLKPMLQVGTDIEKIVSIPLSGEVLLKLELRSEASRDFLFVSIPLNGEVVLKQLFGVGFSFSTLVSIPLSGEVVLKHGQ